MLEIIVKNNMHLIQFYSNQLNMYLAELNRKETIPKGNFILPK